MRVFVFLLMLAIGAGGTLGGYRIITGKDLVSLSDFGMGTSNVRASGPVSPTPNPAPTLSAMSTPVPTSAPPSPTPTPVQPATMVVANTDGLGVYLRRTPNLDDRLRAWVDGSTMEAMGIPLEGDGVRWRKVRAPDGSEGYIPIEYLSPAP